MHYSDQLHDLLATEMDRREFLTYAGAVLLTVLGISGLLRTLAQPPLLEKHSHTSSATPGGYGSSTYGGTR